MEFALINIGLALAFFSLGFLLGSIPNGVIIGKIFFKKDPRNYGSHNSGGTNSGRVFGKKIGILVIILDMIKALIAFYSAWAIIRFLRINETQYLYQWEMIWDQGVFYYWLAFLGASVGHCFSPFLKFKGGKTVAVFFATTGGTSWVSFIVCVICFFSAYAWKKIVSLASMLGGGLVVFFNWGMVVLRLVNPQTSTVLDKFMWDFGLTGSLYFCWEGALVLTIIFIILVARHIANIKRLKAGEEKQLDWK